MAAGDISQKFGTAGTITITLASLASSASRLVGRESTELDVAALNCTDVQISGLITTGSATLTASSIEVWAIGPYDGTSYPAPFDGTDSDETIASAEVKFAVFGGQLVTSIPTNTSANTGYEFNCKSLRGVFGGTLPKKVVFFVTHSTGQNLNSTAGNHRINYVPTYEAVAQS